MTDNDRQLEAVVNALNGIHAELKALNQTVAKLNLAGRPAAPAARSTAPGERSEEFPPKRGGFRPGGGRPPMRGPSKSGPRTARSSASAPPRKKGEGYPKKPR